METKTWSDLTDPIVEQTRRAGEELARAAGYDLHVMCERLRESERKHPERIATLHPAPLVLFEGI